MPVDDRPDVFEQYLAEAMRADEALKAIAPHRLRRPRASTEYLRGYFDGELRLVEALLLALPGIKTPRQMNIVLQQIASVVRDTKTRATRRPKIQRIHDRLLRRHESPASDPD